MTREEAIKHLTSLRIHSQNRRYHKDIEALDMAIEALRNQSEIIRCKDCVYYHPSHCEIWSKYGTVQTREKGYCYMAERASRYFYTRYYS